MKFLPWLFVAAFALAWIRSLRSAWRPVPHVNDGRALRRLRRRGVQLGELQPTYFTLYAPDAARARQVTSALTRLGFQVEMTDEAAALRQAAAEDAEPLQLTALAPLGERHEIVAQRRVRLDAASLLECGRQLEDVAEQHGVRYDGWFVV